MQMFFSVNEHQARLPRDSHLARESASPASQKPPYAPAYPKAHFWTHSGYWRNPVPVALWLRSPFSFQLFLWLLEVTHRSFLHAFHLETRCGTFPLLVLWISDFPSCQLSFWRAPGIRLGLPGSSPLQSFHCMAWLGLGVTCYQSHRSPPHSKERRW